MNRFAAGAAFICYCLSHRRSERLDITVNKFGTRHAIVEVHANGERTFLRNLVYRVTAATLIVTLSTACQEPRPISYAASDEVFDAPIRTETVDLGPSPYYPEGEGDHPTSLTCYYFPDFMVKEHYLGGRGAEWLSILRTPGETPKCKDSHVPGERIIEYPEWEGYFAGVKGHLVLFEESDSVNGGLPFAVFDALNGKKIFEDSAYFEHESSSFHMDVVSTSAGYVLRYLRVAEASCDLHSEGNACWSDIKAEFSLRSDDMPRCGGYEHIAELVGTDQVESMIAYAVEVKLSPLPAIRSVGGPTECWASH